MFANNAKSNKAFKHNTTVIDGAQNAGRSIKKSSQTNQHNSKNGGTDPLSGFDVSKMMIKKPTTN